MSEDIFYGDMPCDHYKGYGIYGNAKPSPSGLWAVYRRSDGSIEEFWSHDKGASVTHSAEWAEVSQHVRHRIWEVQGNEQGYYYIGPYYPGLDHDPEHPWRKLPEPRPPIQKKRFQVVVRDTAWIDTVVEAPNRHEVFGALLKLLEDGKIGWDGFYKPRDWHWHIEPAKPEDKTLDELMKEAAV